MYWTWIRTKGGFFHFVLIAQKTFIRFRHKNKILVEQSNNKHSTYTYTHSFSLPFFLSFNPIFTEPSQYSTIFDFPSLTIILMSRALTLNSLAGKNLSFSCLLSLSFYRKIFCLTSVLMIVGIVWIRRFHCILPYIPYSL